MQAAGESGSDRCEEKHKSVKDRPTGAGSRLALSLLVQGIANPLQNSRHNQLRIQL